MQRDRPELEGQTHRVRAKDSNQVPLVGASWEAVRTVRTPMGQPQVGELRHAYTPNPRRPPVAKSLVVEARKRVDTGKLQRSALSKYKLRAPQRMSPDALMVPMCNMPTEKPQLAAELLADVELLEEKPRQLQEAGEPMRQETS